MLSRTAPPPDIGILHHRRGTRVALIVKLPSQNTGMIQISFAAFLGVFCPSGRGGVSSCPRVAAAEPKRPDLGQLSWRTTRGVLRLQRQPPGPCRSSDTEPHGPDPPSLRALGGIFGTFFSCGIRSHCTETMHGIGHSLVPRYFPRNNPIEIESHFHLTEPSKFRQWDLRTSQGRNQNPWTVTPTAQNPR